ncbi:MAG: SurA N-terminal domain-containing protein [Chthoniobacteraceae bacterium]
MQIQAPPRLRSAARVLACAILAIVGAISAHAQEDPVVATVNTEKIYQGEVFTRLQRLKAQDFILKPKPLTMRSDSAGSIVLGSIINEHIIIQLARQQGVLPTEAEVQAQLAPILNQANVKKMIDTRLITEGQLAYDIRVQDARRNLEKKIGGRAAAEKKMDAFRNSSQITIALPGYDSLANTPK